MGGGNLSLSNKKQREIYVGNLTIGVVTDTMLRDLFNGALAHLVPDPVANPPVINAALDPSGEALHTPTLWLLASTQWLLRCSA